MSMWKECEGLQEELVKMRRELHQIPEFGLDLPETQKYVTDKLDELGIPYKCSGTDSSIIAEIKGGQPGKTVALRADMDALKITEANDVDYKSKHEGLMHVSRRLVSSSNRSLTPWGSSPAVGSSRISASGSMTSTPAMATRFF